MSTCTHRIAYECAACGQRRCWECDAITDTDSVKTAVKWCPAHEREGRLGRLGFRTESPASE